MLFNHFRSCEQIANLYETPDKIRGYFILKPLGLLRVTSLVDHF